jgi:hypothetical protein
MGTGQWTEQGVVQFGLGSGDFMQQTFIRRQAAD